MSRSRPTLARLGAALLSLALVPATACTDRTISRVDPRQEHVESKQFTVDLNNDLDLLFVVDDSGSMEREQDQIVTNFHKMIEVLEGLPTGLPNIHLGVISTDVGNASSCGTPDVAAGVLRNAPMIPGCSAPTGRYISDVDDGNGGRDRNYTGSLSDTFACIAKLGKTGCGFEQPLEAIRAALDPATLANQGFLRRDALLAIVILSDEDDCSAFDPSLFDETNNLGPLANQRCFSQGITCDDGVAPNTLGERAHCEPRDDSPYITPVSDFVKAVKDAKPFENRVVVAGILGDPDPIDVEHDDDERAYINVQPSCYVNDDPTTDEQGAYPAIRTDAFLAQFQQNVRARICEDDLSPAIQDITEVIVRSFYGSCIEGNLADASTEGGLQPDCSVTEIQHPGASNEERTILPLCNAADGEAATNQPCWTIDANAAKCSFTDHHLELALHYPPNDNRDPDTRIDAQCRTQ